MPPKGAETKKKETTTKPLSQGIAIGLKKGHIVTKRPQPIGPSGQKGVSIKMPHIHRTSLCIVFRAKITFVTYIFMEPFACSHFFSY
jgi:hypothetical protein